MDDLEKVPSPGESDHGQVLDANELSELIEKFRRHPLYEIVAVAGRAGPRRGEILALRVKDHDPVAKTLRIERALEETKDFGLRFKPPKTKRSRRTIEIDDELNKLLVRRREHLQRINAGIPDGADVDLSLVKLPPETLLFPAPPVGQDYDFTRPRRPRSVTKEFRRKVTSLGYPDLRFHDLRGSYATACLDAGMKLHTVAARGGHDPAVLLKFYAKHTKKAEKEAAATVGAIFSARLV